MILRHQRAVVCLCYILSGYLIQVNTHTCEVGRERDRHDEWKWVLPYPDLCQCTSVIMGGMNTWTPIRPFVPKYYDSPLLSDDVNEIRGHYGIQCDDGNIAKTSTKAPSTLADSTRRYRTRVSTLSTTDVIDAASTWSTTSTTSTESLTTSAVATSRYRTRISPISTADGEIGQFIEYTSPAAQQSTDVASNPSTDTVVKDKEDSTGAALLSTSTISTTRYRSTAGQSTSPASDGLKSNTDGTTSTSSSNAARYATEALTDVPRDTALMSSTSLEEFELSATVLGGTKGSISTFDAAKVLSTDSAVALTKVSTGVPQVCRDYLGMENGDISNERITASSESIWKETGYAWQARLNGNLSWRAMQDASSPPPWIQADIGYQTYVTGVVAQGDGEFGDHINWVKTVQVSTFYKSNNDLEVFVQEDSGEHKVFDANFDRNTAVDLLFLEPIFAQIVRITCLTGTSTPYFQMRFEILGCMISTSTADAISRSTKYASPATKGAISTFDATTKLSMDSAAASTEGSTEANQVCYDYLGMENGDIPNERITASSEVLGSGGGYAVQARLNDKKCWRANLGSWIQADIGNQTLVTGVVTQGDGGYGGSSNQDWVETLKVSTFSKRTSDTEIFVINKAGAVMVFRANEDTNTAVKLPFPEPLYVQIVRITCLTVKRANIQMRFEILGCKG